MKTHKRENHFTPEQLSGIDPNLPTDAPPGSIEKQMVLCLRYAQGVFPIWHPGDRLDYEDSGQRVEPRYLKGIDNPPVEYDDEWEDVV